MKNRKDMESFVIKEFTFIDTPLNSSQCLGHEPWMVITKKGKREENLEAHSLTLHTKQIETHESLKMKTKMKWQVHEHLMNKSFEQAK